MPRYALLYPVKPDKAEIAQRIFVGSGDPPLVEGGVRLHSTSVFSKNGQFVRILDLDGDLSAAVEMLSRATAVHDVGRQMSQVFEGDYDFTTLDGLRAFFADNLMTTVTDRRGEREGDAA
ncbi:SchA/CurD-like domain-containing protein [Streptomyces sp. NPDC006602]|uniref:SchA/CurD-like domain-containing protein n=1 Tax=Streptomyces sp. NPDC006602 TaxID=3364751 RepID=UPI0036C0F7B4